MLNVPSDVVRHFKSKFKVFGGWLVIDDSSFIFNEISTGKVEEDESILDGIR